MKLAQKHTGHKSIILRICLLVFVVYAVLLLVDMQVNLAERRQERDALLQRYEVQRLANKELERQLDQGIDDAYIERIAREKLEYAYPDERVFIDISGN